MRLAVGVLSLLYTLTFCLLPFVSMSVMCTFVFSLNCGQPIKIGEDIPYLGNLVGGVFCTHFPPSKLEKRRDSFSHFLILASHRAASFTSATGDCRLFDQDRHSMAGQPVFGPSAEEGVDYLEVSTGYTQ